MQGKSNIKLPLLINSLNIDTQFNTKCLVSVNQKQENIFFFKFSVPICILNLKMKNTADKLTQISLI